MEHQAFLGPLGAGRSSERDLAEVVEKVCRVRELSDPQHQAAVAQAYKLSRNYPAPFMVSVAVEMLADLKEDLARDPSARVVFLGRDGHSLALATHGLDGEFSGQHCSEAVLPRHLIEAAVQDREQSTGQRFPEIESFRTVRDRVDPTDVSNAQWRLTEALRDRGVPVGYPNSRVTLVNTGFRGTAQELLAALYPQTTFQGRYLWFRELPDDPHPGSKRGYLLDQRAERDPYRQDPLDPGLDRAFTRREEIAVVEALLSGPFASPERFVDGRTQQRPLHLARSPLDGHNPTRVADHLRDPMVREAMRDAMLLAVSHHARWIEALRSGGIDVIDMVDADRQRLPVAVDAWARGRLDDARFGELLDSFVPGPGRSVLNRIAAMIERAGLSDAQADAIWREADRYRSVADLSDYADGLESGAGIWRVIGRVHQTAQPPYEGGEAHGRDPPEAVDTDDLDVPTTDRSVGREGRGRRRGV